MRVERYPGERLEKEQEERFRQQNGSSPRSMNHQGGDIQWLAWENVESQPRQQPETPPQETVYLPAAQPAPPLPHPSTPVLDGANKKVLGYPMWQWLALAFYLKDR